MFLWRNKFHKVSMIMYKVSLFKITFVKLVSFPQQFYGQFYEILTIINKEFEL